MRHLIQWSIDHHWMVIAMSLLLAGAGFWIARDMPVDVFLNVMEAEPEVPVRITRTQFRKC